MRLSEAIRLGSMLNPQGFANGDGSSAVDGDTTCALVAAHRAIGMKYTWTDGWPWVRTIQAVCPVDGCVVYGSGADVVWLRVMHLNDFHRWTREQIADWVQTIEDAQAVPDPTCGSSVQTPEQVATPAVAHVRSLETQR